MKLISAINRIIVENLEDESIDLALDLFKKNNRFETEYLKYYGINNLDAQIEIGQKFFKKYGIENLKKIKSEFYLKVLNLKCGGYDIDYEVLNISEFDNNFDDDETIPSYDIHVTVSLKNTSKVSLHNIGIHSEQIRIIDLVSDSNLDTYNLNPEEREILNDINPQDIVYEVEDCMTEYFDEVLFEKTGINVTDVEVLYGRE